MNLPVLVLLVSLPFLNKKPERVVDPALSAPIAARLPCDGSSAPEDHPVVKASFSPGGWERTFTVDVFEKTSCALDVKGKCLDKHKEGWRPAWTADSAAGSISDQLSLQTCYAWGVNEPARYVISAWYRESVKAPWKQVALKTVSPNTYEFTAPGGGTGHLSTTFR